MTLPTSDAQSSSFPPQRRKNDPSIRSIPASSPVWPVIPPTPAGQLPVTPAPHLPTGHSDDMHHENAVNFVSHSWDLATGGLKTMTAKRELPSLPERRPTGHLSKEAPLPRNYTFLLIILACLLLMLISGGIVLFVVLQP